jgi:hypothetical protein
MSSGIIVLSDTPESLTELSVALMKVVRLRSLQAAGSHLIVFKRADMDLTGIQPQREAGRAWRGADPISTVSW